MTDYQMAFRTIKIVLSSIARWFPNLEIQEYKYYYDLKIGFGQHLVLSENYEELKNTKADKGLQLCLGNQEEGLDSLEISPNNPDGRAIEEWLEKHRQQLDSDFIAMGQKLGFFSASERPPRFSPFSLKQKIASTSAFLAKGKITEVYTKLKTQNFNYLMAFRLIYDFITEEKGNVVIYTDYENSWNAQLYKEHPTLGNYKIKINPDPSPFTDLIVLDKKTEYQDWSKHLRDWDRNSAMLLIRNYWEPDVNYPSLSHFCIQTMKSSEFEVSYPLGSCANDFYRFPPRILRGF